ncbi:MAG: transposase [Lachnospiraceae bacterium]|nr:transposase [Lachnospiraceae bacterium]
MTDVSNNVTKQAIKDACEAYRYFFKGYTKFPRFKSRKHSIPKFYQDNAKIQFTDTHVKVEGFAVSKKKNKQKLNWIRPAEHGRIPAENEGIGIDLGIKDLAICSNEHKYQNINKTQRIKKLEKRKRRLQRSISRRYEKNKKGAGYCKTGNIIKSEKELLKLNHRLTNIRQNYLHQATNKIVKTKPSFIVLEDLKLSDRIYRCECGNVMDRDYQAALNLKRYGELALESSVS